MSETFHILTPEELAEPEPIIILTLADAAEQALMDLRLWVKDHEPTCDCFTCGESIPDLSRALGEHLDVPGISEIQPKTT